ncbi:MAG: hypothetical protein OEQ39_17015 [Gammaproteobacteria bacterium]|nr:hypothetical protein [Gammaproteobacteria bacterium]MDH3467981.1 hypothetical protein [Gammaproteobacteria bacterium]
MTSVVSIHGTTPAEIFQTGLENIEAIESVAAVVRWRDGRVSAGWSNAPAAEVALMVAALEEKLRREVISDLEL